MPDIHDIQPLQQFRRKTIAKTESVLALVQADISCVQLQVESYKLAAANWLDILSSSSWLLSINPIGPTLEQRCWNDPFRDQTFTMLPTSPLSFRQLNAPRDLWRKGLYPPASSAAELSLTTKRKLADSEAANFKTNRRFDGYSLYPRHLSSFERDALWGIRADISDLLSCFRPFSTLSYCHHGNGASENSQSPLWKKVKRFSATRWVKDTLGPIYEALEGYLPETEVVDCERYSEVPKTYKVNRPIGIQPSLNLYFQLGLGGWLKTILKRKWGLDLFSQERNRTLARIGSRDGNFSTIDLSSASDTISIGVVEFLFHDLPILDYMQKLRVQWTSFVDVSHLNQKFSSMGNGFTFELETIIFSAIVRYSMRYCKVEPNDFNHAVYGDDIIVPSECYETVCELLNFFGFSVNLEKSFTAGPFRESCGADYYDGYPVRSLFSKENHNEPKTLESVIRLANGLYRKSMEVCDQINFDPTYIAAWKHVMSKVPRNLRSALTGPVVEHDGWFISARAEDWTESKKDNLGRSRRLAYVSGQRRIKCPEQLRLDAWFYLANRRGCLLCDEYGKPNL